MEDWITVETRKLKNGETRTKVIYLDGEAAEKRMWDYLKAAKTPEEILQRALHMYAAAASFKRECGPNGQEPRPQTPENRTAAQALAKLAKPVIPVAVRRLDRLVAEYNATKHAEEVIAEAQAEEATKGALTDASASAGSKASRASQAVSFICASPGITVPELAAKMGVKQNVLYKLLPDLEKARKVAKRGRGWFPADADQQPVAQAA